MKSRRVFVTVEAETNAPLGMIRGALGAFRLGWGAKGAKWRTLQVQANVARAAKPRRKA